MMVIDVKSPHTEHSLASEMGLTSERCGAMNLWTMRKTCSGVSSSRGEGLRIYLLYSPWLSKYA
ncbi:hypothetical protein BJ994_003338 [Arthrobacter pigmenti]|uniref:Uncharacterized protein n=1 Tax=Arthrobacter pigmenti TaxID=271432 RepID=A0A846RUS1_9MICC|nr:hypothetical protein [Arthrobacter pigmenti]